MHFFGARFRTVFSTLFHTLSVLVLATTGAFADPIPEGGNPDMPKGETEFMIPLEKDIQASYAGFGDDQRYYNGGAIGGVFLIDNGRLGLFAGATVAAGGSGPFAYAFLEADVKLRLRVPIDPNKFVWVGGGLDISGRVGGEITKNEPPQDHDPVNGYFRAQPVGVLGFLIPLANRDCVLGIYSKVGFGIYDSESIDKSVDSFNVWAKPMVGTEILAKCKSIRVIADYQHIFSFDGEHTDKAFLDFSNNWKIPYGEDDDKSFSFGIFTRGQLSHRLKPNPLFMYNTSDDPITRINYTVLGGIQVLWE